MWPSLHQLSARAAAASIVVSMLLPLLPSAAPAAAETEPNDSFETAEPIIGGTWVSGNCAGGPDFLSINLTARHEIQITYSFVHTYPYAGDIDVFEPDGTRFLRASVRLSGDISFVAAREGRHAFSLTCHEGSSDWSANVADLGDAPAIEGAEEHEHNDQATTASPISASGLWHGAVWSDLDSVDYWAAPYSGLGGFQVRLDAGGSGTQLYTIDARGALVLAGAQITWGLGPGGPFTFAVRTDAGAGNYTLSATFEPDVSMFFAGTDEAEPNNAVANATGLSLAGTTSFHGTIDPRLDPNDYIRVNLSAPAIITARLQFEPGCAYNCPQLEGLAVNGSGLERGGGPVGAGENLTFPGQARRGCTTSRRAKCPGITPSWSPRVQAPSPRAPCLRFGRRTCRATWMSSGRATIRGGSQTG
jgi:hypothetical protein